MNSDDVVLKTRRPGTFVEDGLVLGKYMMLEVHKSPLYDPSGALVGTVGTASNITEQKQAERELQEARDAAEAAARAKSTFLSNTGHEIRTPLNGLIGLLDLTLNSGLTTDQRDNLVKARHSATRLHLLLSNVIECADLERGRVPVDMTRFDVQETVDVCCVRIAQQCQDKSVSLDIQVRDAAQGMVLGDQAKVMRVLDLILDNAAKYTDRGTISVTVERDLSSPEMIVFQVRDTGCGIPEDKLAEIFSSFTQVEDGLERSYEGAGLGLTIARGLVELLRGSIKATSNHRGTKLQFCIPLKSAGTDCTKPMQNQVAAGHLTVLVVDDNMVNRMVLDKTLQKERHHVHTASTGREAVKKAENHSFDLILMDIQMPEMNGYEATRIIRAMESERSLPRTPIISVTANALPDERERFLQAGMDDLLLKPVSRDDLLHIVQEIMRKKTRHDVPN